VSKRYPSMTRVRPQCRPEAARPPGSLTIGGSRTGRGAVVTAAGEVDISNADELRRALESARDTGAAEIWLDLTATTFCDCRGVRTLLDLRASLREGHRRLVLICPPGAVRQLLVMTEADRELEIHSTAAAAARPWTAGIPRDRRGGAHRRQ